MILSALIAAAAIQASQFPLEELPTQQAMPGRCVIFLWTRNDPPLRVAMIDESAGTLRLKMNGKQQDLTRPDVTRPTRYAMAGMAITLDLDLEQRAGMAGGAVIEQGSMRLEQADRDGFVVPVGGIRACQ